MLVDSHVLPWQALSCFVLCSECSRSRPSDQNGTALWKPAPPFCTTRLERHFYLSLLCDALPLKRQDVEGSFRFPPHPHLPLLPCEPGEHPGKGAEPLTPPPAEEQPDNWAVRRGKPEGHGGARAGPSPRCRLELLSRDLDNSYNSSHYSVPCTRHCARHFTCTISFNPRSNSVRWAPLSPITDKETEA